MLLAAPAKRLASTSTTLVKVQTTTRLVYDRGKHVQAKDCVTCGRMFTWRKKWERCWDEVTTCSKRCKTTKRREQRRAAKQSGSSAQITETKTETATNATNKEENTIATTTTRKERKKQMKKERRAQREGNHDKSVGRKDCDTCKTSSDLLVRCRIDATKSWNLICGSCWNKYSGGVPDGDLKHPYYVYGGLWKNLHKM